MQAENLTPFDVQELTAKCQELQKKNEELKFRFYDQETEMQRMEKVLKRVDAIEMLIKKIFGGSVLINGQFVDITRKDIDNGTNKI